MKTTQEGHSSSEEETDERAPLVPRPPGPRPPPRGQAAASRPPPPPPPPPPATSPAGQTHGQSVRQPSPRQNPPPHVIFPPPARLHLPPLPPPSYPPPPPPPPPPAICTADWVLRLRHPGKGIMRLHVPKGMTANLLSQCIAQATDFSEHSVVGLFGYHSGMFVALEHLIACTETSPDDAKLLRTQLYSLRVPEPLPLPPWWQDWRILLGIFACVGALLWQHAPLILYTISAIPALLEDVWKQVCYYIPKFYHSLVTKPLKDTYRYGPAIFGGWEGADLESICARMTYGDRDFWERNFADCENMYLAKESAFLFIGRPLVFLVLLLIALWILRQWLWYRALQDRERYQDRDMIQTYRAIQVLLRQMARMARIADGDRGRRQLQPGRDEYGDYRNY